MCLVIAASHALCAEDWKPIDPADLTRKTAVVEKDADAEAVFWEVRIGDELANREPRTVRSQYIRIKILTNRGRDRWSTVTIPILPRHRITGVEGRTIQPDGSVLELKKEAIFERDLSKTGDLRVKSLSFTLPGVEAGSIIEYRWKDERDAKFEPYRRIDFQLDIPIRIVRYWIKPFSAPGFNSTMAAQNFHCRPNLQYDGNGWQLLTLSDVPVFKAEPRMQPPDQLRAWSLVYYRPASAKLDPDQFWTERGKETYNRYKPLLKVSKTIREKAAGLTVQAKTGDEKMLLLVDFCKSGIKNSQTEAVTAEERQEKEKNKNPEETLQQGIGTAEDIRYLLVALASAAGLEARLAELPSRQTAIFDRSFTDPFFMTGRAVAVKIGDSWRFYDPSATYVPRGMLPWAHEGVDALITDPKEPVFVTTPVSKPEQTVTRRQGTFRLGDDGTLEGDIQLEYTGHEAAARKAIAERLSDAQREEALKNTVKHYASAAEVSSIKIDNASDPEKPLIYRCHVQVSGYAQRTAKRLLFAPSFFQQGAPPVFPVKERRNPVYFEYPWVDEDKIVFELPAGFQLEEPRIPAPMHLGRLGEYEVHAHVVNKTQLVFERRFVCGDNGIMLVPVTAYPELKTAFDAIAQGDEQSISLILAPGASAAAPVH
ncbi:MAG: DUF3857 domain-containing protein [Methylocella sp.]